MLRSDDIDRGAKRTEHENRFDRQLRLWGSHGQMLLESAHICALGSGVAVCETLKNLVLPNVAQFTIVDDAKVTDHDVGNNFFVTADDVGKPRAQVVTANLLEMNPWDESKKMGVRGSAELRGPEAVAARGDLEFFAKFTVVVANGISDKALVRVSDYCFQKNIPFVMLRVNGLIGSIQWSLREHCISESHPDGDVTDMRLYPDQLKMFPQLAKYIGTFDLKALRADKYKHQHVPWPVVVSQQLEIWRRANAGKAPQNFKERKEFKEQIRRASLNIAEESNFNEAMENAHKACIRPDLRPELKEVLADPKAKNPASSGDPFWLVAWAINQFLAKEGRGFLPVSSEIPDITTFTNDYVVLQKMFKDQEEKDLELVRAYVAKALKRTGRPSSDAPDEFVNRVTKHIRTARVLRCRPLSSALDPSKSDSEEINEIFEEWEEAPEVAEGEDPPPIIPKSIYWLFALKAAERFRTKYERYPGTPLQCNTDSDTKELIQIQEEEFKAFGVRSKVIPEVLQELTRFGAAQNHNVAAVIGGVAAQLCLKLIVKQFVPFNNTFVFNGIHSKANTYAM